ncbi:hypothetical protein PVIIG_04807 [Plasmodium vivax India VII]|uniref:Uncharacterized protein n=1 Tax=Plasmodium vivax India VII TaxID=1077284 RepID=A0A0J9SAN3_PLAVI|nr:hypothetical protein PVIIG_04807 [Plasmodium vivax India VII]
MITKREKEKATFECIEMSDIRRLPQSEEKENSDEEKISLDDLSVCSPSKLHRQAQLTEDEEEEQEKLIHSKLYESMSNVNSNLEKKDTHWFDGVDEEEEVDDPQEADDPAEANHAECANRSTGGGSGERGNAAHLVHRFPNLLLIGGDGRPSGGNSSGNGSGNHRGNPLGSSPHREKQPPPSKHLNRSGDCERIETIETVERAADQTHSRGSNPLCSELGKDSPSERTKENTQVKQHAGESELVKWRRYNSSDEEREKVQPGGTPANLANERLEEVPGGEDTKGGVSNQSGHSDGSGSNVGGSTSAMPCTLSKGEAPQSDYATCSKQTNRRLGGSPPGKANRSYKHSVDEPGGPYSLPLLHTSNATSDDEDDSPLRELAADGWAASRVGTSHREREKHHHGGAANNLTRIISRIEESVQEKKTKGGAVIEGSAGEGSGGEGSAGEGSHRDGSGSDGRGRTPASPPIRLTPTDSHKAKRSGTPKYTLRKCGSQSYSNQVGPSAARGADHAMGADSAMGVDNHMGDPLSRKSLSSSNVYGQGANEEEERCVQNYAHQKRPIEQSQRGRDPHSDEAHRHAYRAGANGLNGEGNVEGGGVIGELPSRPEANFTSSIRDAPAESYKRGSPPRRVTSNRVSPSRGTPNRVSPNRVPPNRVPPSRTRKKELEEPRPVMDDTHFHVNPIKINDANLEKCFHAIKDLCNLEDGQRGSSPSDFRSSPRGRWNSPGDRWNSPTDRRNVSLCSERLDRRLGARDCEGGRRWSEAPERRDHRSWKYAAAEEAAAEEAAAGDAAAEDAAAEDAAADDAPEQNVCKSSDVNLYENNFKCLSQTPPDVYRFFCKEKQPWGGGGPPVERGGHAVQRDEGKGDPSSTNANAVGGTTASAADGTTAIAAANAADAADTAAASPGKVKRRIIDCKNERLKWGTTQVIIDIDDTIRSSGGYKFFNYALGGVDAQYQRGETYPGSFQFVFELAMNKLCAEAKPLLLSVLTARIPQVPITEDSFLNKKFNEVAERRGIKSWGIDCDNKILYSTLKEWVWNETRGEKKFVNFKHLHKYVLQQNSLVRYIWIGDTGDMDKQAGEMMIRTYPQRMKAVFLHHVKGKDDNTLLPSDYFIKSVPIFFFRTYIGAATKAHAYNLIDKKGLTRVLVQAVLDLEKSKAPASSSKWEDLIKDIILSDAMDELDKYNAETVNRTKKIIAQRMREISERKLHFIS